MTPIERLTAYLAALPPSEDDIPIDCTLAGPLTVGDLRAVAATLAAANAELNQAPVITRKALQEIRVILFGPEARPGHPSWQDVIAAVRIMARPVDGLADRGA